MAQFMLLLRGGDVETRNYTPEQYQQLIQRYFAWSDQLRREGRFHGAEQIKPDGRVVYADTRVVDGPYAETKEAIGGYYQIEATDYAAAVEVAKGCPALSHGGFVEVREVGAHD